jgi:hypothetical protein
LFFDEDAELLRLVTRGRVSAATLVAIPAFAEARALDIVDDPAGSASATTTDLAGAGGLPLAEWDAAWSADAAGGRVLDWATGPDGGVDPARLAQAYLWADPTGDPTGPTGYRLLIADVVDGVLTAVPAAIRATAEQVHVGAATIAEAAIDPVRVALGALYAQMADQFNDPEITPPWAADASDQPTGAVTSAPAVGGPLTAAAMPAPPRAWFDDPRLDGPTPLTIGDDGRVFGHLAMWNTCHIAYQEACVTAPRSGAGYAYFHTGEVICDDGRRMAVGKLTVGAGHADPQAGYRAATEHYDNTATAAAVVRAGEDDHGIWVVGALVDDLAPEAIATLRRSPLSGDWRRIGGGLELVAALAVNVPGFPIPRAATRAGVPVALIAAGCLPTRPTSTQTLRRHGPAVPRFSPADLARTSPTGSTRLAADAARSHAIQRLVRRIGRDPASRITAASTRPPRSLSQS